MDTDTTELVERLRAYVNAHDEQLLVMRGQHDFIAALNEVARAADLIEQQAAQIKRLRLQLKHEIHEHLLEIAAHKGTTAERDRLLYALKAKLDEDL